MHQKILKIFFSFMILSVPLLAISIEEMTLEQKVGQLFIAYFDRESVNEHATRLIQEGKIGGLIYYNWANGLDSPQNVQSLSRELQKLAKQHIGIPLFVSIDQEGGRVARLRKGFTDFPGNGALGKAKDTKLAIQAVLYAGIELKSVGINLNFAPVLDINSNCDNPIVGIRSFGSDPEIVASFGHSIVEGYMQSGIIPCIKHFPGYGEVTVDSHYAGRQKYRSSIRSTLPLK